MTSTPKEELFALTVHPSVVFKLGEDLITDDVQALTELMKNSYDADSPSVRVVIDTAVWTELRSGKRISPDEARTIIAQRSAIESELQGLHLVIDGQDSPVISHDEAMDQILVLEDRLRRMPEPVQGNIEIADDGIGMSIDDIKRGWLTVSASPKRQMKARGERTTQYNRTPLGDKGLGRLGAQRLGRALDLKTRTQTADATLVASIFWDDFTDVDALSDVPIIIRQTDDPSRTGTTINIRGLRQPDHWDRSRALFQRDIADMISPYDDAQGFRITLRVNGTRIDLRELTHQALDIAPVTYELEYHSGVLHVRGGMRKEYLRPDRNPEGAADWAEFIEPDDGAAFLEWFSSNRKPRAERLKLQRGDYRHFCFFETAVVASSIPGIETGKDGAIADPGPFEGRIDMLARRAAENVFDDRGDYSQWVKAVTGVRLYRNGFGIRMREDWLNLGAQWTTGSSYYTLRPDNVVGHINLTAEHNSALEETSNREEFRDLAPYRNFQLILRNWLELSELFQTVVRRGYNDYLKFRKQDRNGLSERSSSKELARDITQQFERAHQAQTKAVAATAASRNAQNELTRLQVQQKRLESSYVVTPDLISENAKIAHDMAGALNALQNQLMAVQTATSEIADRREVVDLLLERLIEAERQVREVWEVVSLGITAEAVSHEVLNVTDRLRERSRQIAQYNDVEVRNSRFGEYIEQVRSSIQSLHKQVSHLDSSMRYVRDRRETVNVGHVVAETAEYFNARWRGDQISFEVATTAPLSVKMSRGKLGQVLDNLILNSEFWVMESIRRGWVDHGRVLITINENGFTLEDNGPGVDPTVDEFLFDPFVTRKPARQGRGLGLFVVQQLLASEGFSISLDPARNTAGNRFRFRVNLQR
ncbi:HAMP domain-containing sensor histidine kinase [Microbacterium sp. KSW2-29]|uniref:HAMP domain-containing sensor histidine kinase n=1 Tax=Microbacterium phycohabitans TaxID=3075993 RepID=A0ABU3SNQ6_9MICO|nr:HAMP domain-containing sensor histidine kinase [Microbacterium sp. KSW2-29]MDU0346471.1 HAMP domain-containing sensor histidine kinase [Microbacterium sp. KSW2-29]